MANFFSYRSVLILVCATAITISGCGGSDSASVDTVPPTTASTTIAPTTTVATTTTTTTEAPELTGQPAFNSSSSVSTVGIDRITFGMTLAQAQRAVEATLIPVVPGVTAACYQVRPQGGPVGVELTVNEGTIERVDLTTTEIRTRSGAGVGSTEDQLFELFGERLTSTPRDGGGNTIIFTPQDAGDQQFRVIFETDGTMVTSYRSGRVPLVEPIATC